MNPLKSKPLIVVETRGGTVVGIYGRKRTANVVVVDWDEFYDQERPGVTYELEPLSKMPADTRSLVERGLAKQGHRGDSPQQ
jgi:hypothetical protein